MSPAAWVAAAIVGTAGAVAATRLALRWVTARSIERQSERAREELATFLGDLEVAGDAAAAPWVGQVTLCIKTFHRPLCVVRALRSAKALYPGLRVRVADDGIRPLFPDGWTRGGVTWHALPYDVGISAGRNALLDRAETPFIVHLDDDNVLGEATDLGRLHDFLVRSGFDVAAGVGGPSNRALYRRQGDRLFIETGHPAREIEPGVLEAHRVSTFFMAPTERMRELRWNDDLKLLEHTEFFYRAWREGWRVAEIPGVRVDHLRTSCLPPGRFAAWLTYHRFRARVRWGSRILRRLTGRPYLPTFEADGLRSVKTVRVA